MKEVEIKILKKEYINSSGNLLVVNYSATKGERKDTFREGFVISEIYPETHTPFMEVPDQDIINILKEKNWDSFEML